LGSLQDNHAPSKGSCDQPLSREQGANVSKPDDDASSSQYQEEDVLPQQQSDAMVASHDSSDTTPAQNMSSDTSLSPCHGDDDTAMEVSSPEVTKTPLDIVKEFQGVLHNEVKFHYIYEHLCTCIVMVTGIV